MEASEINRTYDLLALVARDTTLRKVGAYHVGPCPFCGGKDRFTLKSTKRGYRWYCRKCGDDKYHTAVDYVMRRLHLDLHGAVEYVSGEIPCAVLPQIEPSSRPEALQLPDEAWQADALHEVSVASDRLLAGDDSAGRDYLLRRGLHRGTWYAWSLGYCDIYDPKIQRRRPAIALPWIDIDCQHMSITAIKYRFIDEQPNGLRYLSRRGSVPVLFGLWDIVPQHDKLLLVEGEMNALSIWQCLPSGVNTLSFGSEAGGRPATIKWLAKRHRRVFVWADDANRATQMRTLLGSHVRALCSPVRDGFKWDANQMLREGILLDFLSHVLGVTCRGWSPISET